MLPPSHAAPHGGPRQAARLAERSRASEARTRFARRSDRCLCKLSVHRQFHLPQEGSEARVAAQLAEGEVELDHVKPAGPLVESAVQPLEGVVAIAAPREDVSDNGRVNIRYLGRQFIKRFLGVGKMA